MSHRRRGVRRNFLGWKFLGGPLEYPTETSRRSQAVIEANGALRGDARSTLTPSSSSPGVPFLFYFFLILVIIQNGVFLYVFRSLVDINLVLDSLV